MHETSDQFNQRITHMGTFLAKYLQTITPYERALVLHEAEAIWQGMEDQKPEAWRQLQAEQDARTLIGQWLGAVVHRLSHESLETLVALAQELDTDERFERLLGKD